MSDEGGVKARTWDDVVEDARRAGGREIRPNGLPIRCVKANGDMLECEGGDHPDYKFPVDVEYVGPITEGLREDYEACTGRDGKDDDGVLRMQRERHALIYTDGYVAVTLYECCYATWSVSTGFIMGHLWHNLPRDKEWRLHEQSLMEIRKLAAKSSAAQDEG